MATINKRSNRDYVRHLETIEKLLEEGGGGGGTPNAVKYTAQSLTSSQQQQARTNIGSASASELSQKQDTLVSGTNIKTLNNQSLLGSGNITIDDQSAVKYTEAQSLSNAQKATARGNIAAASLADINNTQYVKAAIRPEASANTVGPIYLIGPDANDEYERYFTQESNGTYTWVALGSTEIHMDGYATDQDIEDVNDEISHLEAKVTDLNAYLDHSPVSIEPDCKYTNWDGTGKIEKTTGTAMYLTASCQAGDMFFFEVINKGAASGTIWNIVDAEDNLVRRGNSYSNASNGDKGFIVIPTNGVKLIVIVPNNDMSSLYLCRGEKIPDSVKNNETEIKTVAEKVGIIKPEVELIDGKYIYKTGAVYALAGGFLTKPFSALKGDKIKINCVNWYSSGAAVGCVLAKCTGQDASGTPTGITPLVLPTSANRETYEYTLTEDASLTVSFKMYGSSGQRTFAELCGIVIERPVSFGSGEYVPIQQGVGNSGKLLGVGVDGNVTLVSGKVTIDKSEEYVLYQKIKNGDFSDGLDDWTAAPATNVSVEDGMLKINTAASVQCKQKFASIASGHKVYLVYYAKRGSSAANPQASLGNLSAAFTYNYKDTITESLAMYSHLATLTSSVDRITFSRDGSGSIYYVDNVRIYDLTEIFGAGNEPTLEECDALFNETEEMTVKDYVETKIATITDIKENQLSEAVQIKLNAEGGGGTASKWLGAKVGCLGDSITAIDNNLKKYYRYMEDFYTLSGVSVAAISGATISSYSNPFYNRVTDLAADCDLVLVLGGINDFNHGVSIGEICTVDGNGAKTATSDTSTFFGALHTMVQNLITRFPTKPIVLMTPLHSGGYNSGGTSYPSDLNKNSANKYLSDYVQAIKDIGAWYSIPVLDLYSVAGFNPNVADFATEYFSSSADLLHPNTNGHALIANRIEGFLNSIG